MLANSFPMLAVAAVSLLAYFGLLERVLERMRLSRGAAVAVLWAMLLASFVPSIVIYHGLQVNIAGTLIPFSVVVYLLWTADAGQEKIRGLVTILVVAAAVYFVDKLLPLEPGRLGLDIDPLYLPALIAAVFAYVTGRSRRSSFIGAIGGVMLLDVVTWVENTLLIPETVPIIIGGAGMLGTAVLAGIAAVFLAEIVGEIRERIERGPA